MKVSKLFHWLYALLMLMPVFFIGFTCCYVVFNDNAFESYYGETINEEQVVDITSLSDLKENKSYLFTISNTLLSTNNSVSNMIFVTNVRNVVGTSGLQNTFSFTTYQYQTTKHLYIKNSDNTTNDIVLSSAISFQFDYLYNTIADESAFQSHFANSLRVYEYNKYSYLDDVFEYSLDKLEESPYFSWAYDSFLVSPFRYIGNLFSVPSNSVIYLFLSYWLDISIIYLVFDMVMYVPLLVHRWLDKGVLE